MVDMTGTTVSTFLQEQWSQRVSIKYRSNVVLPPLMDRTWEDEMEGKGMGDTIRVPEFSQNTDAQKRSVFGTGASITFDAVTETSKLILINNMAYKAWRTPVEMSLQQMVVYEPLLMKGIPQAIQLKVDSELASDDNNGLDAFSADNLIGTDGQDITEDDILSAQELLDNANAPNEDRFFAVSPASRTSLMKIEAFRNVQNAAAVGNLDGSRGPGFLGDLHTFAFHMTNNLEAGTTGKKNAAWQREAIAYVEQQDVRFHSDINIEDGLFMQNIGYIIYGYKMIKGTFGTEIAGK